MTSVKAVSLSTPPVPVLPWSSSSITSLATPVCPCPGVKTSAERAEFTSASVPTNRSLVTSLPCGHVKVPPAVTLPPMAETSISISIVPAATSGSDPDAGTATGVFGGVEAVAVTVSTGGSFAIGSPRVTVTVLSVLVDAAFALPARSTATPAGIVAVRMPPLVCPVTETLYVCGSTGTMVAATVPLPVNARSTSAGASKPVTSSSNTAVNTTGSRVVAGSICPTA